MTIINKLIGDQMQGYKTGAKQEDINNIRRMTAAGKTVAEISRALLIVESCVASFVDRFTSGKPKPAESVAPKKRRRAVDQEGGEQEIAPTTE